VAPGELSDSDKRLLSGWGAAGEAQGSSFRTVDGQALLAIGNSAISTDLVRLRAAAADNGTPEPSHITLQIGETTHEDVVCKARWTNWPLPSTRRIARLAIRCDRPVRVFAVEFHREARPWRAGRRRAPRPGRAHRGEG